MSNRIDTVLQNDNTQTPAVSLVHLEARTLDAGACGMALSEVDGPDVQDFLQNDNGQSPAVSLVHHQLSDLQDSADLGVVTSDIFGNEINNQKARSGLVA